MKSVKEVKTSQPAPGQSLLKFMDMASDAVKCALKKPSNFKRNINHRRYLQRQVKSFVKSRRNKANGSSRKVTSSNLRDDVQDLVREAIKELKFSHYYANADVAHQATQCSGVGVTPTQLRGPSSANILDATATTYRLTHLPAEKPTTNDRLHPCALHRKQPSRAYPAALPSSYSEDELFMSGEELTNNIDINDLYIPELHEPRSPVVKCEDYFVENDLEIPSPLYDSSGDFQFQFNGAYNHCRPKFGDFI